MSSREDLREKVARNFAGIVPNKVIRELNSDYWAAIDSTITLLEATLEERVMEARIDELSNSNSANIAYRGEYDLQQFKVYTEVLHKLKKDYIKQLKDPKKGLDDE